ncbi:MAG: hypothetical protein ACQER5_05585 [Pseudomonadota bacterium]
MKKGDITGSDLGDELDKSKPLGLEWADKDPGGIDGLARYAAGEFSSEYLYGLAQGEGKLLKDSILGSKVDSILAQEEVQERLLRGDVGASAVEEFLKKVEEEEHFSKAAMGGSAALLAHQEAEEQERRFRESMGGSATLLAHQEAEEQERRFRESMGGSAALSAHQEAEEHERRFREAMGGNAYNEVMQQAERLEQHDRVFHNNENPYADLLREHPFDGSASLPNDGPLDIELENFRRVEEREDARDKRQQRLEEVNRQQLEISAAQYEDNKKDKKHQSFYNRVTLFLLMLTVVAIFFEPQEARFFVTEGFSSLKDWVSAIIEAIKNH